MRIGTLIGALLATMLLQAPSLAQKITIDGSLTPAQPLIGPTYDIKADYGRKIDGNLFHSFGKFSLGAGDSANFSGPANVANVIGRVTGGESSSIAGAINSNISGANLYLINPAGMVFTPTARVNVSGSFHASTADYIRMSDGTRFQATNPGGSTLSAAPPAAFGFLTANAPAITVDGSQLGPVPRTLGIVAGPITIANGATLSAPAGTIHLTGAASTGEVPVDPRNTAASTVTRFAPVSLTSRAKLDVSDPVGAGSGGSVFVKANALTLDLGEIDADNHGADSGGVISLHGADHIAISNRSSVHAVARSSGGGAGIALVGGNITHNARSAISTSTGSSGRGGDVAISAAGAVAVTTDAEIAATTSGSGNAGTVTVDSGSLRVTAGRISTKTTGTGLGGDIRITTAGDVTLNLLGLITAATTGSGRGGAIGIDAGGSLTLSTGSRIIASTKADGDAGSATVKALEIAISTGAQIETTTEGRGSGGAIVVTAINGLTIVGWDQPLMTAITSEALEGSTGNAGKVTVVAGSMSIASGGGIGSGTLGAGNGGDISVRVGGAVRIDGSDTPEFTGIEAKSRNIATGDAGSVFVEAGNLTILSGGLISASTHGGGQGGNVTVKVFDSLEIDSANAGGFGITGITSNARERSTGNAGTVVVYAGSMSVLNGGGITTNAFGTGSAGMLTVDVTRVLTIDGTSATAPSAISSQANAGSDADAGIVTVSAGTLSMTNGAMISTSAAGAGRGGDILIRTTGDLSLASGAQLTAAASGSGNGGIVQVKTNGALALAGTGTGIFASTTAGGNAGSVIVDAGQIALASGAQIASTTAGIGHGGEVKVLSRGSLVIDGVGTQIAASATGAESGAGGSVIVSAANLAVQGGGQIASTATGIGRGGDIKIDVVSDVFLSGTGPQITALSSGRGDAGSIAVNANAIRMTGGAAISTEARIADGGNITLNASSLLRLSDSAIFTSATGSGGNIAMVSALAILERSRIHARAQEGHGGNIRIVTGQYLQSADSMVDASSEKGISGIIDIAAPRVDLNGSLVVLPSELLSGSGVVRTSCAARSTLPQSSLTEGGRGGLLQDPESSIPALYLAGRDAEPAQLGSTAVFAQFPVLVEGSRLAAPCR